VPRLHNVVRRAPVSTAGGEKTEGTAMSLRRCLVPLAAAAVAGCAAPPAPPATPPLPDALRPPPGQALFVEALATGVQIYECKQGADVAAAYEWAFRAPEATLVGRDGAPLGKHYGGPTWEAPDGSTVVGQLKARDPGPDARAIPWLLLDAKSTTGSGVFTPTKSIVRMQTTEGLAPQRPCSAGNAGEVARVPYTATYGFYR
jgi:hypothetical protein